MDTRIKVLAGLTVVVGAVFLLAPEDRINGLSESAKSAFGHEGLACLNYHRKSLKDPESARLLSTTVEIEEDKDKEKQIAIKYKAKNSYGGSGETESICWFRDGVVKQGNI